MNFNTLISNPKKIYWLLLPVQKSGWHNGTFYIEVASSYSHSSLTNNHKMGFSNVVGETLALILLLTNTVDENMNRIIQLFINNSLLVDARLGMYL